MGETTSVTIGALAIVAVQDGGVVRDVKLPTTKFLPGNT